MSAQWDACGQRFKDRSRTRMIRINALGEAYAACYNFGNLIGDAEMRMIGMDLYLRALKLMFEDAREMRQELHRVGYPGY